MVKPVAHNGPDAGSNPALTTNIKKGDRVMVWHVKGGWKRMKVVSIGYKWLKVKYISKRIRHLKIPVSEIGRFVKETE